MAMIAGVSQLKSKLTEKGVTRPSVLMCKKMPSGSSELQEMPRRYDYEEGAGGDAAWCKDVDAASVGYGLRTHVGQTDSQTDRETRGPERRG